MVSIHLAPYDGSWPVQYAALASRIREGLAGRVCVLEHVGSTAVPGLSAKPAIDIVLAVPDSTDEASYVPQLEQRDFRFGIREPDWFEHRLLKGRDVACNLHVFSAGCAEVARMLAFRDRLRVSAEDRTTYEQTKRALARRTWEQIQDYADAKSDVVRKILARAPGSAPP
jgi:GrpB-like predicted nucleotidyltransferase (UPF0157 family)